MWPMVPIIHMYYRMTQLGRGFALNAALSGPSYIFTILVRPISSSADSRRTGSMASFVCHFYVACNPSFTGMQLRSLSLPGGAFILLPGSLHA